MIYDKNRENARNMILLALRNGLIPGIYIKLAIVNIIIEFFSGKL